MIKVLTLAALLSVTSCTGAGNAVRSLGVSEGENALACLKGTGNTNATVVNGSIRGVTIELPTGLDLSGWTAEQIEALINALCGEA